MKIIVELKGRPVSIEQVQLLNGVFAAANVDETPTRLIDQCAALGIAVRYPPPAIITKETQWPA